MAIAFRGPFRGQADQGRVPGSFRRKHIRLTIWTFRVGTLALSGRLQSVGATV